MEWALPRVLATEVPDSEAPLMMNEEAFGPFHARTDAPAEGAGREGRGDEPATD